MEFSLFQEFAELKWYTWVFMAVALLVVFVLVALITRRKANGAAATRLNARALVYGALCVAMSFVLSYVKLFSMPQGGSITMASILPICLYAYWFGLGPGIAAGAVYGVLQFIQEPIIVHWAQPMLDYLLAFACLGLAGMWKKRLPLGILLAGLGRVFFTTISGVVFFSEYAWAGWNVWLYSVVYNVITIGPDVAICIIIALIPAVARLFERLRPKDLMRA